MTSRICEGCGDAVSPGNYGELELPVDDGVTSVAFRLCDWCSGLVAKHPILKPAIRRAIDDEEARSVVVTDGAGGYSCARCGRDHDDRGAALECCSDVFDDPGLRTDGGEEPDLEEGDEAMWCTKCEEWWLHECSASNPIPHGEIRVVGPAGQPMEIATDGGQIVPDDVDEDSADDQQGSVWLDCPACETPGTILAEGDLRCDACGETFEPDEVI